MSEAPAEWLGPRAGSGLKSHGVECCGWQWRDTRVLLVLGTPPLEVETWAPETLSDAQRKRAGQFYRPEDRRDFLWRSWLLRELLGTQLGVEPGALRFVTNAWGKPALAADVGWTPLEFNLSRTRQAVAVAWSTASVVGVDVEYQRPLADLDGVARQVMHPREWTLWKEVSATQRVDWFYTLWTAKEAVMKCAGYGMSLTPSHFEVDPGGAEAALQCVQVSGPDTHRWEIEIGGLEVRKPWRVAVAQQRRAGEVDRGSAG